jgi:putative transposon-encoded protein
MARKIELKQGKLLLKEDEIEGFLERTVTPIGTSAKADVPRRYLKRRVYVIITKKKVRR